MRPQNIFFPRDGLKKALLGFNLPHPPAGKFKPGLEPDWCGGIRLGNRINVVEITADAQGNGTINFCPWAGTEAMVSASGFEIQGLRPGQAIYMSGPVLAQQFEDSLNADGSGAAGTMNVDIDHQNVVRSINTRQVEPVKKWSSPGPFALTEAKTAAAVHVVDMGDALRKVVPALGGGTVYGESLSKLGVHVDREDGPPGQIGLVASNGHRLHHVTVLADVWREHVPEVGFLLPPGAAHRIGWRAREKANREPEGFVFFYTYSGGDRPVFRVDVGPDLQLWFRAQPRTYPSRESVRSLKVDRNGPRVVLGGSELLNLCAEATRLTWEHMPVEAVTIVLQAEAGEGASLARVYVVDDGIEPSTGRHHLVLERRLAAKPSGFSGRRMLTLNIYYLWDALRALGEGDVALSVADDEPKDDPMVENENRPPVRLWPEGVLSENEQYSIAQQTWIHPWKA